VPRQPLPIGTWGKVRTDVAKRDAKGRPIDHRAQAYFRDHDGRTRLVSAYGKTKSAAENSLRQKLQERAKTSRTGELTAMHKFRQAAGIWEAKFAELVADGRRSPTSLDTYRRHLTNHVLPAMGEVRLGEAKTPLVDRVV
jgi:hypothetical protein